jgi:hypothetical protein
MWTTDLLHRFAVVGPAKSNITKADGIENRLLAQGPGTPEFLSFENCVSRQHNTSLI